ncbi:TraR/DksA C4-type zinc finger protein [Falsibacillus pallidus]|uniref:TraR/DksA family transcriptional regulator n=1 Tax=Falsibacillus pallidus TaxID=493781 RepID=A0A370GM64_9BACI|nr:TraR/DksA C4-type zinc finger protein [Falsibacillus pallidus]RDI44379.1 TraR/DksA family transcriptional regulator [Falsibacillus pallidus]
MLTTEQLSTLKKELTEQRQQFTGHLKRETENMENRSQSENSGELSMYDNHPADMGTELYEREKDFALDEHEKSELEKVNQALEAMEEGTYGNCKTCGQEIPFERLEAIPTTLYCKEHSDAQHIASDRPVEEDLLEPAHGDTFRHQNQDGIRDYEDSFQEVARYGTSETPSDFKESVEDFESLYNEDDYDTEGFTEDYESFVATDIDGKNRKVYPSKKHEEYEERLESEDLESPIGNIPYKKRDSYLDDDKKND